MAYLYIVLYTVLQWLMSQCNTRVTGNKLNTTQFLPFWALFFSSFWGSLWGPLRPESTIVQFHFLTVFVHDQLFLVYLGVKQKRMLISCHFFSHHEPVEALKGLLGVPIICNLFVLLSNLGGHKTESVLHNRIQKR